MTGNEEPGFDSDQTSGGGESSLNGLIRILAKVDGAEMNTDIQKLRPV